MSDDSKTSQPCPNCGEEMYQDGFEDNYGVFKCSECSISMLSLVGTQADSEGMTVEDLSDLSEYTS